MGPSGPEITRIDLSNVAYTTGYYDNFWSQSRKVETKKERTERVAKELMFASWGLFHQVSPTIIKIKQICKPRHKKLYGRY